MHERDVEAVLLLADSLLGAGRPESAVPLLRGLEATDSRDVRIRRLLVRALLDAGDYAAAEPVADALTLAAAGDDLPPALFFHAHSLWGCGKVDESRRSVDRYAAALAAGRG